MNGASRRKSKKRSIAIALACFITLYITSYYFLSRDGYRRQVEMNDLVFYYVSPYENDKGIYLHRFFSIIYMPLYETERFFGSERKCGKSDILKLSKD